MPALKKELARAVAITGACVFSAFMVEAWLDRIGTKLEGKPPGNKDR
jgi:hypothetical protein